MDKFPYNLWQMKTKYTPEIVERILSVFRETGSDKASYLAANINADTFYKWKKRHPEFAEALAIAAAEFRSFAPESYIEPIWDLFNQLPIFEASGEQNKD